MDGNTQERLEVQYVLSQGLQKENPVSSLFPEVIGQSEVMCKVFRLVEKVAKTDGPVLLLGESGTGKELIASAIHRLSMRAKHPFIALNCSAIPEELLESELFGHVKGAFTGAVRDRQGFLGAANQGTLFLDEVGEMSLRLQTKLLRVLQQKTYSPVGSTKSLSMDARIVAATNMDLEKSIQRQTFRLDLFYRLNVFPIHLPPLRNRKTDIECLLLHFLEKARHAYGKTVPCWFSPEALAVLCQYEWPGNVRELQNIVERIVLLKEGGCIALQDVPSECHRSDAVTKEALSTLPLGEREVLYPNGYGQVPVEGFSLPKAVEDMENHYIAMAMAKTHENKNQAARLLGLNRTTLVERLKKRNSAKP